MHLSNIMARPVPQGAGEMSRMAEHMTEDKKILHGMGYAQELARTMGKFSNFAISFSIICILSGGINSLGQATSRRRRCGNRHRLAGGLCSSRASSRWRWRRSPRPTRRRAASITGARSSATASPAGCRPGSTCSASSRCWAPSTSAPTTSSSAPSARSSASRTQLTAPRGRSWRSSPAPGPLNHFGIRLTAKLTDFSGYLIFGTAVLLTIVFLASRQQL